MSRCRSTLLAIAVLSGTACLPDTVEAPRSRETSASSDSSVGTGTLAGSVRLADGISVPAPRVIVNTTDPAVCGESHTLPAARVDPDTRGVADVIVSLTGTAAPPASPAAAAAPLVLDNRGCRFDPHVAVATVGSLLEAVNSDDVLHTIHLYGPRETNVSLPVEGARQTRVLATPGLFVVKCDVHGWMEAHLRVDEHPFHGVTDALGAFRIEAIPAGAQALEIWHEHFGTLRRELTITAGETTRLEIELTKENAR